MRGENRPDASARAFFFSRAARIPRRAAKWALQHSVYRRALYDPPPSDKPFLVRLDITNSCNLRCKMCHYDGFASLNYPARPMAVEEFALLASRLFPWTFCLQLACSFEPLTHPRFPEILRELARWEIPNVGLVTNATLLEGERAEALIESCGVVRDVAFSINAATPETYAAIHGKNLLEKAWGNVGNFIESRRVADSANATPSAIKINTVLMRSNIGELPALLDRGADMGVDAFQFTHVEPFSADNPESLLNDPDAWNDMAGRLRDLARERGVDLLSPAPISASDAAAGRYDWSRGEENRGEEESNLPSHPYPREAACVCPWMTLVIDCRGDLYPCARRSGGEPFANILRQDRREALNALRILRLRRHILLGRKPEVCAACRPTHPYGDPLRGRPTNRATETKEI